MKLSETEYQVGNWIVDWENHPNCFQIEEIKKNTQGVLAVFYRNGSCMDTDPEPIPLTEELLLNNCGFKKADATDSFGGYLSPEISTGSRIRLIKDGDKFYWNKNHITVKILYIHELQNLFRIFKFELSVKL